MIQYHLDENVDHAVAEGLRRRGINVTTTADVGLHGASDEEHLVFATANNRVIITKDKDFLKLARVHHAHAGIVYYDQNKRSIGEIIRSLVILWEQFSSDDIRGRVEFL